MKHASLETQIWLKNYNPEEQMEYAGTFSLWKLINKMAHGFF